MKKLGILHFLRQTPAMLSHRQTLPSSQSGFLLPLFTLAHPLVDAASCAVLVLGGLTLPRIVAYNALAFALQLPLGLLLDRHPRLLCPAFLSGLLLASASVLAIAIGARAPLWFVPAALGNALFHLAAGKQLLDARPGRAVPVALFISTGALGLAAAPRLAASPALPLLLLLLSILLLALAALAACLWPAPPSSSAVSVPAPALLPLAGLFLLVAARGAAALFSGRHEIALSPVVPAAFGLPAIACLGKALGGVLGDRWGRGRTTLASVAGSAALVCAVLGGFSTSAAAWMALLFLAQLATGPVLSLLHDRAGRRGGLAFGLNCLALFFGSVG